MCGRFTLNTTGGELARQFELEAEFEVSARYNIAPTDKSPVVRVPDLATPREAVFLRWGLVPFWADDPSIGNRMISARAETVPDKSAYRAAFQKRRCLVPASGFYEWKKTGDGKQPYYIRRTDEQLLGFAGLWERWSDDQSGEVVESFTILTGEPNDRVADLHDRMPVIVKSEDYDFWLDPAMKDKEALHELALETFPADPLEAYPVSTHVNKPTHDDPSCIEPLEER